MWLPPGLWKWGGKVYVYWECGSRQRGNNSSSAGLKIIVLRFQHGLTSLFPEMSPPITHLSGSTIVWYVQIANVRYRSLAKEQRQNVELANSPKDPHVGSIFHWGPRSQESHPVFKCMVVVVVVVAVVFVVVIIVVVVAVFVVVIVVVVLEHFT